MQKLNINKLLEERLGISKFIDFSRTKMIPHHKYSTFYYLGGAVLFLGMLQIATGILLLFYYKASADAAHESVARIMTEIPYGWLIRSIHHWGSNLMILLLLAHFFSTMIMKAYRKPRELSWLTGMGLLGVVMTLGFSGYILPWDERALFAVKVGTQMPEGIPLVGEHMRGFLRGGDQVGDFTLNRFFALHVGVMPWLLAGLMGMHMMLIQLGGISVPIGIEQEAKKRGKKIEGRPFFPYGLFEDFANWAILLGILITLAVFLPAHLEAPADMLSPAPDGVKPDWFFLAAYQTLKIMPATVFGISGERLGTIAMAMGAMFVAFTPFLDRKAAVGKKGSLFTAISWLILIYFVVMSLWGYFS